MEVDLTPIDLPGVSLRPDDSSERRPEIRLLSLVFNFFFFLILPCRKLTHGLVPCVL